MSRRGAVGLRQEVCFNCGARKADVQRSWEHGRGGTPCELRDIEGEVVQRWRKHRFTLTQAQRYALEESRYTGVWVGFS
jgi:hypothetical protein